MRLERLGWRLLQCFFVPEVEGMRFD
jgi:hypothetical protein